MSQLVPKFSETSAFFTCSDRSASMKIACSKTLVTDKWNWCYAISRNRTPSTPKVGLRKGVENKITPCIATD
ncbi:uncharacterized protein IAS62_006442 [Cryptococcus decagattii]|uniref:Uncharacterized protein n=1 Tax=Cryptococcus decagattii TaxID=1859122 RepID=A0ABZ2B2M0_9TREE